MDNKIKDKAYLEADRIIQPLFENLELTFFCSKTCLNVKNLQNEKIHPEEAACLGEIIRDMC